MSTNVNDVRNFLARLRLGPSTGIQSPVAASNESSTPRGLSLPPSHFLSIARNAQQTTNINATDAFDASTLAAADFDVDARTGFMPPTAPVVPLPDDYHLWEAILNDATADDGLVLGDRVTNDSQREKSARWRVQVDQLPTLSVDGLKHSEVLLRRAHMVLTYTMHLYIHSQPPPDPSEPVKPISIPPPLSVPLAGLYHELSLPPVLTYSDTVLYNWTVPDPTQPVSRHNIKMHTLLSHTPSEEHFYRTSALIELRGVEALGIMRASMDEAFVSDNLAVRRISTYLGRLAQVIDDLAALLMSMKDGCDPSVFYNDIRPWFNGWSQGKGEFKFEGIDEAVSNKFARLTGPSAGQSSLIHALDIFLGVSHTAPHSSSPRSGSDPGYLKKMEQYMPRHHRAFLNHLRTSSGSNIREMVLSLTTHQKDDAAINQLRESYDAAVLSLKKLRDGHIRIATLYIISQARKVPSQHSESVEVTGTGGTKLVPFLKQTRDNTLHTIVGPN